MVPFKSQEFRSASWFWNGETDLSRCGAVPSPSTVSDNILLNSEEKLKAVIESRKCWDGQRDVNRCGVMRYPLKAISNRSGNNNNNKKTRTVQVHSTLHIYDRTGFK